MSVGLGALTIASGQTTVASVGRNVSSVVIANESNSALIVQVGATGPSMWLPAWTVDRYDVNQGQSWDGNILLNAQTISSGVNTPSSVALVTTYYPGDPIQGTYPMALSRQTNIGNGVIPTSTANSIILSGETPPNDIIKSSPLGYSAATIDIKDDGTVSIYGQDAGTGKTLLSIAPSATLAAAIDLLRAAIGSAGQLTIDSSGNLSTSGTLTASGAASVASLTSSGAISGTALTASGAASVASLASSGAISGTALTMTAAPGLSMTKSLSGSNQQYIGINPSDGHQWGVYETTGDDITFYDATSAVQPLLIGHNNSVGMCGPNGLVVTQNTSAYMCAVYSPNSSPAGTAYGHVFQAWSGSALNNLFSIGGTTIVGLVRITNAGAIINGGNAFFTGAASGTYAHRAGATPNICLVQCSATNSSETTGYDSLGSTTVHVTSGVGLAFKAMVI